LSFSYPFSSSFSCFSFSYASFLFFTKSSIYFCKSAPENSSPSFVLFKNLVKAEPSWFASRKTPSESGFKSGMFLGELLSLILSLFSLGCSKMYLFFWISLLPNLQCSLLEKQSLQTSWEQPSQWRKNGSQHRCCLLQMSQWGS